MGLIMHKGVPYGGGSDVVPNPQDAATDELEKLGIDGDVYEVVDSDYQNDEKSFTTNDYSTSTHTFTSSTSITLVTIKGVLSALSVVFNALKTAINDHAGVLSNLSASLSNKVTSEQVTFNELREDGHRFGDNLSNTTAFTATSDASNENTNFSTVKTVVNNLADYTEENVQVESLSDTTPYLYRQSPAIGTRVMENALVGASVVKNQLAFKGDFQSPGGWTGLRSGVSTNNGELTATCNSAGNIAVYMTSAYRFSDVKDHKVLVMFDMKSSVVSERTGRVALSGSTLNDNYVDFAISSSVNTYKSFAGILYPTTSGAENIRIALMGDNAVRDTMTIRNVRVVDLTQWFGSSIADNAYTKEQSTAGSGIAWLKSQGFDFSEYIAYNTGTLESVNPSVKKVVGKNLFKSTRPTRTVEGITYTLNIDGTISVKGTCSVDTAAIYYTNSIDISSLPPGNYYFCGTVPGASNCDIFIWDTTTDARAKQWDGVTNSVSDTITVALREFQIVEGHSYLMALRVKKNTSVDGTFKPMVCLPSVTSAEFEPYTTETYSISQSPLRGVPTLVNDAIVYDGDVRRADGSTDRKYGEMDMGDLNWGYQSDGSYFYATNVPKKAGNTNMICSKYAVSASSNVSGMKNLEIKGNASNANIYVKDSAYTDATLFKTAVTGQKLQFEKATVSTESLPPYTNPQKSFVGGTEEWITDNDVPVGHQSEYKSLPALFDDDYIQTIAERAENAASKVTPYLQIMDNNVATDVNNYRIYFHSTSTPYALVNKAEMLSHRFLFIEVFYNNGTPTNRRIISSALIDPNSLDGYFYEIELSNNDTLEFESYPATDEFAITLYTTGSYNDGDPTDYYLTIRLVD